jgi:helix-turn-helix protein
MPPIGETLREARLRRGVDVAEVSARTKIRTKYLRALENDDFGQLPGPTYVRTFLRTYADYLGLDSHLLVEEYRVRHPDPPDEEPLTPFAPTPSSARGEPGRVRVRPPRSPRPPASPAALVVGGVLGLIVLFLVIGLLTGSDEGQRPLPTPPTQAGDGGGGGGGGGAGDQQRTERQQERRAPKPEPDRVELVIKPVDATYLCVDDGRGTVVFEDTITGPERFSGKILRVNMGNATSRLLVNGEPAKVKAGPNPVGYMFTPKATRPVPDGDRPCQ